MGKSICIVQTNRGACDAFAELAAEVMPDVKAFQVVDDSLLGDINAAGGLTPATLRRLYACYQMAQDMGADAIFHTCVVAADAVDLIAPFVDVPVVRIDEHIARAAVEAGEKVAVLATAPTALGPSAGFVERLGAAAGKNMSVERVHLSDAVAAMSQGYKEGYDRLVREAILKAAEANDAVILAQPSMAALLPLAVGANAPVLAPGRSGFELLKARLGL